MIVFSDCLFPALTLCAAAIETLGHTASPTGSETREMFSAALGRLLEFLRQDCCFAREDVQRLLQIKLRQLCPNLSAHFVLVAQLEASAGITNHYNHEHHRSHQQQQIAAPPPDASPWTLVRARNLCTKNPISVGFDCRCFYNCNLVQVVNAFSGTLSAAHTAVLPTSRRYISSYSPANVFAVLCVFIHCPCAALIAGAESAARCISCRVVMPHAGHRQQQHSPQYRLFASCLATTRRLSF